MWFPPECWQGQEDSGCFGSFLALKETSMQLDVSSSPSLPFFLLLRVIIWENSKINKAVCYLKLKKKLFFKCKYPHPFPARCIELQRINGCLGQSGSVGWSIFLCTERVMGSVPSWVCTEGNQMLQYSLSLSSMENMSSGEDWKRKKNQQLIWSLNCHYPTDV